MWEAINDLLRNIGLGLISLGHGCVYVLSVLKQTGGTCSDFIHKTFRAHYNVVGQYTAPVEQDLFKNKPPAVSDLNWLGQLALIIVPVIPIAWLLSITLAPVIYNSVIMTVKSFKRVSNLSVFDLNEKLIDDSTLSQQKLPWYRKFFGIFGAILGATLGLPVLLSVGLVRVITNSGRNMANTFVAITKLGLEQNQGEDDFQSPLKPPKHLVFKLLGAIGHVVGLVAGSIALFSIMSYRTMKNSYLTAKEVAQHGTNLAMSDLDENDKIKVNNVQRNTINTVLGIPGYLFGFIAGGVGFIAVAGWRTVINSSMNAYKLMLSGADLATQESNKRKLGLEHDAGSPIKKYGFGFLGLVPGLILGSLAFCTVGFARIVQQTVINAKNTFVGMSLLALPVPEIDNDDSDTTLSKSNNESLKRPVFDKSLGALGYVLGGIAGSVSMACILTTRVIINTTETAYLLAVTGYDKAHETPKNLGITKDIRSTPVKLMGTLGYIPGAFLAAIAFLGVSLARIAKESAITTHQLMQSGAVLADDDDTTPPIMNENRKNHLKFGFGFLGFIPGIPLGLLSFSAVGGWRVLKNSAKTAFHLMLEGADAALAYDEKREAGIIPDTRKKRFRYGLGFLGLLPGALLAVMSFTVCGLARSFKNCAITTFKVFKQVTNPVLPEKMEFDATEDKRTQLDKNLGTAGYLFGYGAGSIAFCAIAAARTVINSGQTAYQLMVSGGNLASINRREKIGIQQDDGRSNPIKFGFGFLGLVPGALLGFIGFNVIGLGRIAYNTIINTRNTVTDISRWAIKQGSSETVLKAHNATESEKQHLLDNEPSHQAASSKSTRSFLDKYLLGSIGYALGGIIGSISFAGIMLRHTVVHSAITAYQMAATGADLASKTKHQGGILHEHSRTPGLQFGFGLLGTPLGLIFGAIAFSAVGFARITHNSVLNAKNTVISMSQWSLNVSQEHNDADLSAQDDDNPTTKPVRDNFDRGLGIIGYPIGAAIGGISSLSILVVNSLYQSTITAGQLAITGANLARVKTLGTGLIEAQRANHLKYGFGLLGIIPGFILASLGFMAIGINRIVENSVINATRAHRAIALKAHANVNSESNEANASESVQNSWDKGLGFLGYPLGMVTGSIGFSLIIIKRSLYHSWHTTVNLALSGWQLAFSESAPLALEILSDDRDKQRKFGFGFLGVIIGSSIGGLTLTAGLCCRTVINSFHSWQALSASMINGCFENSVFDGLAGDDRLAINKSFGAIGYSLAVITTLPVTATIILVRKLAPYTAALAIGLIASPIVGLFKVIKQGVTAPRFPQNEPVSDEMKSLQNINSSLTVFGQLPEGGTINSNQDGRKGLARGLMQTGTFNSHTVTEEFIYRTKQALQDYISRGNSAGDFFNSGDYEAIVTDLKGYYQSLSCMEYSHTINERNNSINAIHDFIKDYVADNANNTVKANFYSEQGSSWSSIFWGKSNAEQQITSTLVATSRR